jgi:hypothetical protein
MKLKFIIPLVIVSFLSSCSSIPKETVELSKVLGNDIKILQNSHKTTVKLFYDKIIENKNIYLTTINEGEYSHKEILIDIDELSSVTDKIKLFIKNTSTEGGKHNYILDYENNSIVLKKYSQEETISIKNLDKLSCLLSLIIKRSRKLNN